MMFSQLKALETVRWRGNIYTFLSASLLLMLALYSLCRVVFYFYNADFFPGMTMDRWVRIAWGGMRFDLTAILYLNILFILLLIVPTPYRFRTGYIKLVRYLFIVINSVGLATNIADTIYYPFTLRRTTLSVLNQFENERNFLALFFQFFIDYWYALLAWAVLVYLMIWIFRKLRYAGPQVASPWVSYGGGTMMMLLCAGLVVAGIRGGFGESTRPITLSNAAQYATDPKDVNIILNTPFALLRTARTPVIQKVNYFPEDQLDSLFNPVHIPAFKEPFEPRNVVVIILESFSREFIGAYNRTLDGGTYRGYAPFLDSLIAQSTAFRYSTANGRKSIDAMPSVICSIPSIEVPFVLSHYSGNRINSLAGLLRGKGYYTAFFHGAPNGSMGFQAFANACGFHDYFGKDEYGNDADHDGIWGIWDHRFLQYYAQKMNEFKEPFYTNFFSVSSHHPYKLPDEFKGKFPEGEMTIYKCIRYTDYALKEFFQTASKMPWYKNTLFVITADHASAQIHFPEYNTAWGYFSIPIFFFDPQAVGTGLRDEVVQQIDIMPTILGKLKYDQPYMAFGRDALNSTDGGLAVNYLNNQYQLFQGQQLLQFDGTRSTALYNYVSDPLLKNNLLTPNADPSMENYLKAFIQQYNNRMVEDRLVVGR